MLYCQFGAWEIQEASVNRFGGDILVQKKAIGKDVTMSDSDVGVEAKLFKVLFSLESSLLVKFKCEQVALGEDALAQGHAQAPSSCATFNHSASWLQSQTHADHRDVGAVENLSTLHQGRSIHMRVRPTHHNIAPHILTENFRPKFFFVYDIFKVKLAFACLVRFSFFHNNLLLQIFSFPKYGKIILSYNVVMRVLEYALQRNFII